MSNLFTDIRFATRMLARSPWFTGLAVVTLALGIGANTALFSLLDAVLFKGLPYREPDRLVTVFGQDAERAGWRVPIPLVEAVRERATTIESLTIHNPFGRVLRTAEGPVRVSGQRVSPNFVDMMGVPPFAGRGFLPDEGNPGATPVMVVSFGLWQQYLGGDPEAVGRTVYLDDVPFSVVGIMPPEFQDYLSNRSGNFWTPYTPGRVEELERQAGHELWARLTPGSTPEEAQRELDAISAGIRVDEWREAKRTFGVLPLKEEIVGDSAYVLQLLLVAVGVVLAIACANLAQLLLARSDHRVSEFATRKAIGAPTAQLFRLALAESLLLSAAGGLGGVALAYWLLPAMLALAPSEIPRITEAAIDGRVLAAAVALAVLTGCVFGLAPALRLSRLSVLQAMKGAPGGAAPRRAPFRSALIVGQVACSVALFVMAGLIGRTFLTLLPTDPGFAAESRSILPLGLPTNLYPDQGTRVRRWAELLERVEALPGVTAAGVGENVPFGDDDGEFRTVSDLDHPDGALPLTADRRAVSSNFFQLLQMPLLRGRIFTSADGPESPGVAIVNEALARRLVPGGDALGRKLRIRGTPLPAYEIVGVVANARSTGISTETWDEVYIPYPQSSAYFGFLIVRSQLDGAALDAMLREEVRAWAPERPQAPWQTATAMEDLMSRSVAGPRFSATLAGAFSGMALLLAAVGVFGLVAYSVSQGLKEYGIRAALGARPRDLAATAMGSAAALTAAGVVIGLVASIYSTQFIESQLYGIQPLDPLTFLGAGTLMLAAAGLAAYLAARRATRVDPMTALRYE